MCSSFWYFQDKLYIKSQETANNKWMSSFYECLATTDAAWWISGGQSAKDYHIMPEWDGSGWLAVCTPNEPCYDMLHPLQKSLIWGAFWILNFRIKDCIPVLPISSDYIQFIMFSLFWHFIIFDLQCVFICSILQRKYSAFLNELSFLRYIPPHTKKKGLFPAFCHFFLSKH